VQIGALTTWSKVAGGINFSLAIKTDGTLWSWGYNGSGPLGLNNQTDYSSPVQVGALTTWVSVSASTRYVSAAIKTDGTLWTWGSNSYGSLGLGNKTSYSSPKQVGALTNWLQAAAGGYHIAAIKTNGTLWTFGRGDFGALGNQTTYAYAQGISSPVQIGALTIWNKISAGFRYTTAIATQ
jgi:alpha-tubulin suppressor-like RCC1 family protein